MLPLPVTGGRRKYFGGVVFARSGPDLEPIEQPQFIWCHLPERILPSPSYLFAQALDPFRYAHGMKEHDFYKAIHDLIAGQNIITWDAGLFEAMDQRALQVFCHPTIASDAGNICALRTALFTAARLGDLPNEPALGLDRCAVIYKETAPSMRKSPERRLVELSKLTKMLFYTHQALLSYELRPGSFKQRLLDHAVQSSQILCGVLNSGSLVLIRVLKRENGYFKALAGTTAQGFAPISLSYHSGEMVSPLGVLTPKRCSKLSLALEQELHEINRAAVPEEFPIPAPIALRQSFTGVDRAYLERALNLKRLPEPEDECTPKLMEYFYLYLGDHERGRLGPVQYKQYEYLTREALTKAIKIYISETNNLINYADEKSADDAALIAEITRYPMTL